MLVAFVNSRQPMSAATSGGHYVRRTIPYPPRTPSSMIRIIQAPSRRNNAGSRVRTRKRYRVAQRYQPHPTVQRHSVRSVAAGADLTVRLVLYHAHPDNGEDPGTRSVTPPHHHMRCKQREQMEAEASKYPRSIKRRSRAVCSSAQSAAACRVMRVSAAAQRRDGVEGSHATIRTE